MIETFYRDVEKNLTAEAQKATAQTLYRRDAGFAAQRSRNQKKGVSDFVKSFSK
jgi:hypothetical protein